MPDQSGYTTSGINTLIDATVNNAHVDSLSRLVVSFVNGDTAIAGSLKGIVGPNGSTGPDGPDGPDGLKGAKGVFNFQGSAAKILAGTDATGNVSPKILGEAFKMTSGSVDITPSTPDKVLSVYVKFPVGYFTEMPVVVVQPRSSQAGAALSIVTTNKPTPEGFTIYYKRSNTTAFSVGWLAVSV